MATDIQRTEQAKKVVRGGKAERGELDIAATGTVIQIASEADYPTVPGPDHRVGPRRPVPLLAAASMGPPRRGCPVIARRSLSRTRGS
jgi:hypothetical protein